MSTRSSRFHFVLIDEGAQLPARYQRRPETLPPGPSRAMAALAALVEAFTQLGRRGPEASGWAPPLADNPLSFVLESISDAVLVRQSTGEVLYRNRAALTLPVLDRPPRAAERVHITDPEGGSHWYERRCLLVDEEPRGLVIEILSVTSQEDQG